MRALQRERCAVVVEGRIQPRRGVVTHRAVLRIGSRHVVWNAGHRGCVVVVRRVTPIAICGQRPGVIVRMACRAGDIHMRARERE